MTDLETLRAKTRSQWDVHQIIAEQNAKLRRTGKQPSNEQLMNERRAGEAVELARKDLLAAMARN